MTGRNNPPSNGWTENKKLVLHRQEEVEHELRNIRKRIEKLEKQYAIHAAQSRMAAGVIGSLAGLVPVVVSILLGRM